MFKKNIVDDSKQVIEYYEKLLLNIKDNDAFIQIKEFMEAWSKIVKTKELNTEYLDIFADALSNKNEYVWYEAGVRLAKLLSIKNYKDEVLILLDKVYELNQNSRFNVVALCNIFEKDIAEKYLKIAINDKSNKVREKVADIVLQRQDKSLLHLLNDRLEIEKNKKVIDSIYFTIHNFDKMKKDKDGSLRLEVGL